MRIPILIHRHLQSYPLTSPYSPARPTYQLIVWPYEPLIVVSTDARDDHLPTATLD
jgi:hypothetical protein